MSLVDALLNPDIVWRLVAAVVVAYAGIYRPLRRFVRDRAIGRLTREAVARPNVVPIERWARVDAPERRRTDLAGVPSLSQLDARRALAAESHDCDVCSSSLEDDLNSHLTVNVRVH